MATQRRTAGRPGTGFVNLGDWSQANSAGAQRLSDTLAGNAQAAGAEALGGLNALGTQFGGEVVDGSLWYNSLAAPTSRDAKALAERTYTGPDSLRDVEGYEPTMQRLQDAEEGARQVGDLYGRATQLGDLYGKRGDYTSGQRLLDSALAGSAGAGRFNTLAQQWGGLMDKAVTAEETSQQTAAQARESTAAAAQQYAALAAQRKKEEFNRNEAEFASQLEDAWRIEEEERRREDELARNNRNRGTDPESRLPPGRKGADDFFKGW